MKVLIEYADNPSWNMVAEGFSWIEIMVHVGCTATRLTVLSWTDGKQVAH